MANTAYPINLKPNPFDQYCISAGFRVGDLVFLSGHVPINQDGLPIEGGFDEQANLTFENLQRSLKEAGSSMRQNYQSDHLPDRHEVTSTQDHWVEKKMV